MIKTHEVAFPPAACQKFVDNVVAHLAALNQLELSMKPKHHMWMEMACAIWRQSSPAVGGTWVDEAYNLPLKHMCATAHRMVWHYRVLASWTAWKEVTKRKKELEPKGRKRGHP